MGKKIASGPPVTPMSDETPLVHRAVRTGGVLLAVAAAQFVAVAVLVESRYPGFGLWTTSLTALGSSASPWGAAFNASLVVFGGLVVFGILFAWSAFDARRSRGVGLFVLLVAAVAILCIGAFGLLRSSVPSNAVTWASYVGVGATGLGLVIVTFAMHRHERWRVSRAYTFATGVFVLAGSAVYATHLLALSPGTVERVVVGVALLWAIVEGLHIALLHRFAPGLQVKVAAA